MEVEYEFLAIDIPEETRPDETPDRYSTRITLDKLHAAWNKIEACGLVKLPVLCADTEVVLDQLILGKPHDYQDAFATLKRYSGRSHDVLTSVVLIYGDYQKIFMNKTTVHVATLSDTEIHHYLALGDYKDKAGSYGIQSYFGQFINKIEGCFYSVMGLHLHSVKGLLEDISRL